MNVTEPLASNATNRTILTVLVKVCTVVPIFCLFLFFLGLMFHVFATHRHFMESSRYILFVHMLVMDMLQLLTSVLLFFIVVAQVKFSLVFCMPLLFISTVSFKNTPVILATMSLERYVAIVYPLHRPALWRSDRIWRIILALCVVCCIHPLIDLSLVRRDPTVDVFSTPVTCRSSVVNSSGLQIMFQAAINMLFFVVVALVILYTYVKILLETRKMRQDKSSVNKAMHTVLLHGAQLLLCLLAFMNPITENLAVLRDAWHPGDIAFFNFFCFILIPRFLSPLIYGFRDQSLRGHMKKILLRRSRAQEFR